MRLKESCCDVHRSKKHNSTNIALSLYRLTFLDVAALLSDDMGVLRERNVDLQGDPSSLSVKVGQDQLSSLLYSQRVTNDFHLGIYRRGREREKGGGGAIGLLEEHTHPILWSGFEHALPCYMILYLSWTWLQF